MTKIAGSGPGAISQRHGSEDPDPDPDPHQNVIDPQHWSCWGGDGACNSASNSTQEQITFVASKPRTMYLKLKTRRPPKLKT
jgi:hypothetical protein